jgi:hypothetical protein
MIYKGNYKEDTDWIGTTTNWIVTHSTKPVIAGLQHITVIITCRPYPHQK